MDNPLQETAGGFTFSAMNTKWLSTLAIALLPAAMVVSQPATADEFCVGSDCEITFSYTGDYQTWSPPPGAKDVNFEIYGAAGGRGGAGGYVSGSLTQLPETLYIFVGGVGQMGSGVSGGFNGGGGTGGNSGTEGAGGGASDIRLDQSLTSRIVVAGGGGGGGGEAGGNGGAGGLESAAAGGSGQGSGGGGANQSSGGFAGASNGGFQPATAGSFGVGGTGGFSTFSGGGGGGGGWYGGGGGGADDNTCCSDGGAGGGGSSYADPNYTSNVQHQAGVNWGQAWITIRYTLAPYISYMDLIQINGQRAVFTLEASEQIVGLAEEDVVVSGAGCEISSLTIEGTLIYGAITGCESGEVTLTLNAESFGQQALGPMTPVSRSLYFDATPPQFSFTPEPFVSSSSNQVVGFETDQTAVLGAEDFEYLGCQSLEVEQNQLFLSGCSEGDASVTLKPNTLADIWQNSGPLEPMTFSFQIDQTAPVATWSDVVIEGSGPFTYSAALSFSERVVVENLALAFASTADCETGNELLDDQLLVWAECDYASLEWSFAGQVWDLAGNQMQQTSLTAQVSHEGPEVVAEPAPQPAPSPVVISPPRRISIPTPVVVAPPATESEPLTQSSAISQSEPVSASPETSSAEAPVQAAVESEPETQSPISVPISQPEPLSSIPVEEIDELEVFVPIEEIRVIQEPTAEPQASPTDEPLVAQPVAGPALETEQPGFPWLPVGLMLGLGVLGFGAWRFSGR